MNTTLDVIMCALDYKWVIPAYEELRLPVAAIVVDSEYLAVPGRLFPGWPDHLAFLRSLNTQCMRTYRMWSHYASVYLKLVDVCPRRPKAECLFATTLPDIVDGNEKRIAWQYVLEYRQHCPEADHCCYEPTWQQFVEFVLRPESLERVPRLSKLYDNAGIDSPEILLIDDVYDPWKLLRVMLEQMSVFWGLQSAASLLVAVRHSVTDYIATGVLPPYVYIVPGSEVAA